jgi:hypothetical protein
MLFLKHKPKPVGFSCGLARDDGRASFRSFEISIFAGREIAHYHKWPIWVFSQPRWMYESRAEAESDHDPIESRLYASLLEFASFKNAKVR